MRNKIHQVFSFKKFRAFATFIIAAAIVLNSCKIYKPAYFFKDIKKDTTIAGFVNSDMELKIQKNDALTLSISSLNPVEDALYNKAISISAETKNSSFQVSTDGNIYLHKLGRVPVAGLTRKELKTKLENDLLPYLKDPIVSVNFANHRVTLLGDATSTIVEMPEEKLSLLDVMASNKSSTLNSRLNDVMVIREDKNTKIVKHLNLEDPSIFTSSWYYVQPNDIIVVKPNEEKIDDEQKRSRNQVLYTTIVSGITFLFLIIDRITR